MGLSSDGKPCGRLAHYRAMGTSDQALFRGETTKTSNRADILRFLFFPRGLIISLLIWPLCFSIQPRPQFEC